MKKDLSKETFKKLLAEGLNYKEIASELGISHSYASSLGRKFGFTFSRTVKFNKQALIHAVKNAINYQQVFKILGSNGGGNTYQIVKKLIQEYKIDTSHFLGSASFAGKRNSSYKKPEIFTMQDRKVTSYILRNRMIEVGFKYICYECGQEPIWNNKPLTLHVHHIDGNNLNCNKDNLMFLCPHCHSQTENFGSKKLKKKKEIKICNCGNKTHRKCGICIDCFYNSKRKVQRPTKEQLLIDIKELSSMTKIGIKYGVSRMTVKRWIKFYEKG